MISFRLSTANGHDKLCRVVEKYVTTPDRMVWVLQLLLAKLRKLDKLPPWDEMVGYGEDTEEDDTEEDDDDEENEEEDEDEDDRVHKSDVVDNGDNNGDKDGSQENRTEAPA